MFRAMTLWSADGHLLEDYFLGVRALQNTNGRFLLFFCKGAASGPFLFSHASSSRACVVRGCSKSCAACAGQRVNWWASFICLVKQRTRLLSRASSVISHTKLLVSSRELLSSSPLFIFRVIRPTPLLRGYKLYSQLLRRYPWVSQKSRQNPLL